ncbi:PRC-barrel domain-containing protein [Gloeocapsopsis crepidinum LEGE 06123]|uniref:PRC-barrel domain-containing protein n=1 Tax=Gloeocapsopsis crepidinum LEGE 06123 TaxID=588587 RepID=A0ABR9UYV7_9CHRO|nr:PRC-barrel domain-containing protein [Gloeocapsopsis crepidinum]MBE9193183.1 PRC-barrel domain-containing protein [Gloeocapsopsis crepidinum LEGE 06123]
MTLYKLDEYYPDYQNDIFDGYDIKSFDVYAQDDKVGSVKNIMVDEDGNFRYFIVDTGFWVFGKNVFLPVGMANIDYEDKRVYAPQLTKQQVEDLPEFSEDLALDNDYEERVRGVYRPYMTTPIPSAGIGATTYTYAHEPYFYNLQDRNLTTYQERLRERGRSRRDI